MSKLYTEEEIRKILNSPIGEELTVDEFILKLTPIKIPSIEELEKKSVEYSTDTETKEFYKDCCWDFQNGAKWMRDKIKENLTFPSP